MVDRRERPFTLARVIGVALLAVVILAALFGDSNPTKNLAPVAVYVLFWVGLTALSALFGDIWYRGLDPFPLLAAPLFPMQGRELPYRLGHWPAAAGLLAFVWVELVLPGAAEPRLLAILMVAYSSVVLIGAALYGRPALADGDAFAAWFSILGKSAPVGRSANGRLRVQPPFVGLASMVPKRGTVALVVVGLGSTAFDGLTRGSFWSSFVGDRSTDEAAPLATLGLALTILLVGGLYYAALAVAASLTKMGTGHLANAFVHSLVPIAVAYAIAHYFSLLLLEGQAGLAAISDPFAQGWDLFGTRDRPINYTLVSPNTTAYVQVIAIVIGHVAGVVLAHDRALALAPKKVATKSQYPLLVMMVLLTVGGLGLLLGG